jgi:hypothetical protein
LPHLVVVERHDNLTVARDPLGDLLDAVALDDVRRRKLDVVVVVRAASSARKPEGVLEAPRDEDAEGRAAAAR